MFSNSNRDLIRTEVIESVFQAIQQGMTNYLVSNYVEKARIYGQKYNISDQVEEWLKEGRTIFPDRISAEKWAKSLP